MHDGEPWRSGAGDSVKIGYENRNGQQCCGHRGVRGADHGQYGYKMRCGRCGWEYGANGSDVHLSARSVKAGHRVSHTDGPPLASRDEALALVFGRPYALAYDQRAAWAAVRRAT